jgi:hypothetical protein
VRERIAQTFTQAEDVLYVGLGAMLAVGGLALLVHAALFFARSLMAGEAGTGIISVRADRRGAADPRDHRGVRLLMEQGESIRP